MIDSQKTGVGIVTCNRPVAFKKLLSSVLADDDIDDIIVVKNKHNDYGSISYGRAKNVFIEDDVGVGCCKNAALEKLLALGCQHIFLIEDDIEILDDSVFKLFIDTAKHFNLGHLNWNTVPGIGQNPTYAVRDGQFSLDVSYRLCGCFSYFSKEALAYCGLIDDIHYVNAFDHVEHCYRIAALGHTTPFYAFAGAHDADKMLANVGTDEASSTIDHSSELYAQRLKAASNYFAQTYGRPLSSVSAPSQQEVINFINTKMHHAK